MTSSTRAIRAMAVASALLVACRATHAQQPDDWSDPSPHRSGFVTASGVRLEYLDWGGTGPALVLIHGLADSPHIFDEIAPALTDRLRVVAYARRGHGRSEAPASGYDNATLVEDLRLVLDGLGIERASLLGWSLGGNEITEFAARHPERVDRLVYLESGYDWSDSTFLAAFRASPVPLAPVDSGPMRSLDAYRDWYRETWLPDAPWTAGLEAYIRDVVDVQPDGSVVPKPGDTAAEQLFASVAEYRRDYGAVRAPALALYSTAFYATPRDPARAATVEDWERANMVGFRRASVARIRRELTDVVVREVPGTSHMSIGLLGRDAVVAAIRSFLLEGPD